MYKSVTHMIYHISRRTQDAGVGQKSYTVCVVYDTTHTLRTCMKNEKWKMKNEKW